MTESASPQQSILLLGRSLYMAAIEAGLRGEPGIVVRRMDDWSPHLLSNGFRADAVLVDSLTAHAEALAAIVGACPEILVIELAARSHDSRQSLVRYGELRTLASVHDLAELIIGAGSRRENK